MYYPSWHMSQKLPRTPKKEGHTGSRGLRLEDGTDKGEGGGCMQMPATVANAV